jgi:DnaJ-class molecular chaperone
MKTRVANPTEQRCPACDGMGVLAVIQPAQPGRRLYPPPCKACDGKGRIPKTDIGNQITGSPLSEAEHFRKCPLCGGDVDTHDRVWIDEHQQPPSHPAQADGPRILD